MAASCVRLCSRSLSSSARQSARMSARVAPSRSLAATASAARRCPSRTQVTARAASSRPAIKTAPSQSACFSSTSAKASGKVAWDRLHQSLEQADPEVFDIVEHEKQRLRDSLILIPSENFTSVAVLDALGTCLQNKYSEGYPGARYYGGNEFIDQAESLCQRRALEAFHLDPEKWGVNVQSLSGSPANFEVYTAVIGPHGRLMALDLPHGGHLSHGYATATKKVSAVSMYFECLPYRLNEETGLIDYDAMEASARLFRPQLIVGGASAYSRHVDYARMRKIADEQNAFLLSDMSHISGLVAGGACPSPFDHADIVTTTTHKVLRGPRGALIFFRKGVRKPGAKGKPDVMYDLEDRINSAVFPGHQGGPHNHTITANAVALKQVASPEFKEYTAQVVRNSARFAARMMHHGYELVSGGTDNHLFLVDLRKDGITGSKVEKVAELALIALNKNTVPGDKSAMNPHGIRVGTPAMTTRGFKEDDFDTVGDLLHRAIQIAKDIQDTKGKKLTDFVAALDPVPPEITKLRADVKDLCHSFPTVGYPEETMRYK